MRLLQHTKTSSPPSTYSFSLIKCDARRAPQYAILSHRWGADDDEVSYHDIERDTATPRVNGYKKLRFCAEQAARDGLMYFWVDTCCIDKSNSIELQEAVNSMYKWYQNATKCYVYLPDVSVKQEREQGHKQKQGWEESFRRSTWFARGWTLQELLAPRTVEFFSKEGTMLGDKRTLEQQIHQTTGVSIAVLQGKPLSQIANQERFSWSARRRTTFDEDTVYCLLGIFDVHMPLIYDKGRQKALMRLQRGIKLAANPELYDLFDSMTIKPPNHLSDRTRLSQDVVSALTNPILRDVSEPALDYGEHSPENLFQHCKTAATLNILPLQQSPEICPSLSACSGTISTPFTAIIDKEADGRIMAYQTITFQAPCHEYSLEELRLTDSVQQLLTTDFHLVRCSGTGITPFLTLPEKDANEQKVAYQTITCQVPFQEYSLKELRLADSRPCSSIGQLRRVSKA